jgi:hypothetical protein
MTQLHPDGRDSFAGERAIQMNNSLEIISPDAIEAGEVFGFYVNDEYRASAPQVGAWACSASRP